MFKFIAFFNIFKSNMKKEQYIEIKKLTISKNLYSFVNKNLLPGTGISNNDFWKGFSKSIHKLTSKNKEL